MKMKKSLSVILSVIAILFASCSNWMKDDNFYGKIENDVKVANAANVSVYIRYANSKMGTTDPSGFTTLKQDIPAEISAVTNDDYGFVKWVAFSTENFPTGKQYSNLFYESAEKYAQDFQSLELPANEVVFEDPYNPATKVTLETTRADIFITPLVAKRPTVVTSVPSNGSSDIVRNTSIRILFSKKMDASSLVDEFGNSNIVITSGSAVLTETSSDIGAKDVTENCTITLGKTGKMLTISPKTGFYFDNNSQITVSIYDEVSDVDGYGMNGKHSFSFTTGVKLDSLAPRIDWLWASTDADFGENHRFEQYKYILDTETNMPVYKTEIDNATNKLSDFVTGDTALVTAGKKPILKQRVKDYLNIYVQASDIAGSGGNVDTTKTEYLSESSVALVQIRACLYVDAEGKPVTTSAQAFAEDTTVSSDYYIETKDIGYAPGLKDSDCLIKENFETVFPTRAGGTLFTYDLRHLPDGLIKIDIWAVDMVGNSGETESYVKQEYNNNYRSIFVVKDSTAPDAATEKAKVITKSGKDDNNNTVAPYEWYNNSSLSKVTVQDQSGSANLIHDASNEFLRSDDTNLKWIFKVGNDPSWAPSPTAAGWTNIHDSSNAPEVRTLSDAVSSVDGPVNVTMCLMDDLGNVSKPVLLKSINYDNTDPVVPSTASWVKEDSTDNYSYIVSTTDKADLGTSGHILKIPFTEVWAGLRRIQVTVQKNGTGGAVPQDNISIRYIPQSGSARNLAFASGSDSTYKIISVTDEETDKVTTGDLYISGLKIGNVNGGTYQIKVDLWDSSLNHSVTTSDISIDTVNPEIEKVYIPGLKHSISVSSSRIESTNADHWFLPHEYVTESDESSITSEQAPCDIPLYLFVKEADSGIHKISFDSSNSSSDSVKLFAKAAENGSHGKTTLYKIENYGQQNEVRTEVPGLEYTIDETNKTITLVDNPTVKLSSSSANGFVILVDNIGFKDKTTGENTIKVTVEDLATLKHIEEQATQNTPVNNYKSAITVDLAAGTTVTGVYSDSYLSITPAATLEDRGRDASHLAAVSGYTNESIINITVTLDTDSGNSVSTASSGYNKINLNGASFINDGVNNTVVKVGNVPIPYELSSDKKTITFRNKSGNNFTNDYIVIRGSDSITINNVLLDSNSEPKRTVNVKAYDLAGWQSSVATKQIIFDDKSPELFKGPYTTYRNEDHRTKVYPHYKDGAEEENQTGIDFGGVKTFFTSTTAWSDSTAISAGLGIHAKDGVSLYGTITTKNNSFLLCYKHVSGDIVSEIDKAKVIASGSLVTSTKKNGIESTWVPGGDKTNKDTESIFQICFETGTYSAVIVDKAGNCSDVFHFAVVEDVTGPVVTDMQKRVLLQRPDNSSNIYRPENSVVANDLYDSGVSIRTKKYVTKKITSNYQIILNLGATYDASSLITKISGAAPESVEAYTELNATASSSPIEKYVIVTNYSDWPKTADSTAKYVPSSPSNSDWKDLVTSASFTDDCDGIQSKVDGNKNLIIKLPNNRSVPVISVFLQDACGNSSYIVLGCETTSEKETAPCFIVDDRLGAATTVNGVVTEPYCIQFPFMVVDGTDINWDGVGFNFTTQSGNAEPACVSRGDDGVGEQYGFMKDKVKKATYYNPALTDSNPKRQIKLGLALHYDGSYGESVTFPVTQTTKASKADGEAGKYTLRGLLYCTQSSSRPSYNEIMNCLNAENQRVDSEKTGQVTDWTYLQEPVTNEARILLDYPRPDYDKLGWTVNETNREPKPYYMWYLLEDRVGNYELAKVVNSCVEQTSRAILYGSETDSNVFDKWLYDGKGPELTIRNTTTKPDEIGNTQDAVNQLIATNNGNVPYLDTANKRVWVSADYNVTARGTKNTNAGWGTTHKVENGVTSNSAIAANREYMPFADLEVNEITGIRAFCWSTSATAPSYSEHVWDGNTQGDYIPAKWYPGCSAGDLNANIGVSHSYGNSINAYFSYTESSSSYRNVYSGTKINTLIPGQLLSATSDAPLYLHVMDWTGNIASYRMGSKTGENESTGLQFRNDKTAPGLPGSFAAQSVPNQYYLTKDSNTDYVVRIAGKGSYATSHEPIQVEIPGITEGGSGIKGIAFGTGAALDITKAGNGEFIELDYDTYSHFGETTATSIDFYVYDNVGNVSPGVLKAYYDTTPPQLDNVTVSVNSGKKMYAGENGLSDSKEYDGYSDFYEHSSSIPADKLHTIYVNDDKSVSFTVNLTDACVAQDDLDSIEIYKRNNGKWEKQATGTGSGASYSISSTNISYTASGNVFQILAKDKSGNTSCQYFKIYLDNVAPTFAVQPTVTIKTGSVNKVGDSTTYAYYSDASNPMKITLNVSDAGVGSIKDSFEYKIDNGLWTSFTDAGTSEVISFTTTDSVEKIYIRDILGNTSTELPKFKYTAGSKTANDITKLVRYADTVAVPDMEKLSVMTRASWTEYKNEYYDKNNEDKYIVLKSKDAYGVKLTFNTNADGLSNIMGYIDSDYLTDKDSYSLLDLSSADSKVKKVFTYEQLPMAANYVDVYKSYYAIDYAGNKSATPLTIKFTYVNPEAAQDVEFVPADSTIISSNTELQTALLNASITLAPTYVNGNNLYYKKNGYILIRCTLNKSGTGNSTETAKYNPKKVTLYNDDTSCGEFTIDGSTLKRINLGEEVTPGSSDTRYYCYLAFKLGDNQNAKKLHCIIDGGDSKSDKVPLFSSTGADMTWNQDTEAPTITSQYVIQDGQINKLKGFVLTKSDNTVISTIGKAKDSFKGNGYQSNLYPSGAKVFFKWRYSENNQYIKDNSGSIAKYKIVITTPEDANNENFNATASASDTGWKDISTTTNDQGVIRLDPQPYGDNIFGGAHCYMFELPDVTSPHCHLALFLMDKFGNVSAPYYLVDVVNDIKIQWWLKEQTLSDYTYTKSSDNKTYSIKLPLGTVVNNISVENAEIDSVSFADYNKGNPGLDKINEGWIILKDSSTVGLTVTLKDLEAGWSDKPVKLKINTVEKTVYTIPAKTFTKDNIQLGTGDMNGSNFEIPVTLTDGAPANKITSVSATPNTVTATWDGDNKKIILSNLPSASWTTSQDINLTINSWDMGKVHTIDQLTLQENQFNLGTAVKNGSNYEIPVTFTSDTIPSSAITTVSATNSVTATWDGTNKNIILSGLPAASWDAAIEIGLTVNSYNKGTVVTIAKREIQSSDITVSDLTPAALTADTDSVTFKLSKTNSADDITINSVSLSAGGDKVELRGPSSDVYTLTAIGEGAKIPTDVTVTLKVTTNHGDINKPLYASGVVQQNRISATSAFSGLIDTSKLAGGRDLAATQITTMGRGIIMNKDFDVVYSFADASTDEIPALTKVAKKAAKKAAKQAKATAKTTEKATAKKATETVVEAVVEVAELPVEELAAPVPEDAVAMLLPQTANTKQTEPQASVSATLVDTAAPTTADEAPQNNLVLKLVIALVVLVLCGAFVLTLFLKKKAK